MAKKPKKPEADAPEAEGDGAPGGGGKKKLILMGGAGALVLALAGGGWFFLMKPKPAAESQAKAEAARPATFVDLPDMTVNLSVGSDRPQYLRVKVALEVNDAKTAAQITPIMPRVIDAFQVFLREMRPSDLDGSAGVYRLRDELTRRVNTAVYPAKVSAVLFREIVVQ